MLNVNRVTVAKLSVVYLTHLATCWVYCCHL